MAAIPELRASVHWRELLTLHLVADVLLDSPSVHIDRPQLLAESAGDVTLKVALVDSRLGFVNRAKDPDSRVFFRDGRLVATGLANRLGDGAARIRATGRFMGSGESELTAELRPEGRGPNFGVRPAIGETETARMNDLLRAHGKLDVSSGRFSLYTELDVADGAVSGHVKPLFRDTEE